MVKVNIRGKEFPLCLTVAALDKINDKCGGLAGLASFLYCSDEGDGATGNRILMGQRDTANMIKSFRNTAWMLALLIEEGAKNHAVCAQFDVSAVEPINLPSYEQLCSMCNIYTMLRYRGNVIDAITASMQQDIEASHSKNVENAEQE